MISFKQYLTEMASSVEDETLGHLTHVKDIPHEDARHAHLAHQLLSDFHSHRVGHTPAGFGASLKHDGGASVIIKHDDKGVAVSDKHRAARGAFARTESEIDQHFGHAPEYAASMKHLLRHGSDLVHKGREIQGDLLYTSKKHAKSYTPNRITNIPHQSSSAPIGLAVHTEYNGGVAHAVSNSAIKKSRHFFVPEHDYSHPDSNTYSKKDRETTEHHLAAAKKLLDNHTTDHLTPEHVDPKKGGHFLIYNNRSARAGVRPTVAGYQKHLKAEGEKAASKLKSNEGQARTRARFQKLIDHVSDNREQFQRSLDIRHHLERVTDSVLKGVKHPDLGTSIDGKKSPGEGVVLQRKDSKGRMRHIAKLVPLSVQKALGNNPRFAKTPLKENILWIVKEIKAQLL